MRKWAMGINFDLQKKRVKRVSLGRKKHKYPGFPKVKKERKKEMRGIEYLSAYSAYGC